MSVIETSKFSPGAFLVPFLAAGAMALESINTPVAEAGGCSDGKVITSPQTSEDELRKMEKYCQDHRLIMPQIPTEDITQFPTLATAIAVATGMVAGLYYLRRREEM